MRDLVGRLPFPPQADESARGLIARVAEDNLAMPDHMATWLGLPRLRNRLTPCARQAALKLGIDPETLASYGIPSPGGEPIMGQMVPPEMISPWCVRVCPGCLADKPYHRRLWEHRQFRVCPLHQLALLERCPECVRDGLDGRLGWNRANLLLCPNGHSLPLQHAPRTSPCIGAAAVYRAFNVSCPGPELPRLFGALPGQAVLDLSLFLGRMEIIVAQRNPSRIAAAEMLTDARLLEAGAAILLDWPGGFHRLCDSLAGAYGAKDGTTRRYGYVHRFVRSCGTEPYAAVLRETYAAELARYEWAEAAWPTFLPKPRSELILVSEAGLPTLLGVGTDALSALKRIPLWNDLQAVPQAGRTRYYRRSDVLAFKERIDRLVTPSVLDRRLGIGKGRAKPLCEAGVIPTHAWKRHARDRWKTSVDLEDADAFMARVLSSACRKRPRAPVTFGALIQRIAARRVVDFVEVVRSILSGRLKPYMSSGKLAGFAALAFDEANVDDVLDELEHAALAGRVRGAALERRLCVPPGSVGQLLRAGLLPARERRDGYLFEAGEVERCVAEFVSDGELARRNKVFAPRIRQALELAAVRPVTILDTKGCKQITAVYRRAEAEAAFGTAGATGPSSR